MSIRNRFTPEKKRRNSAIFLLSANIFFLSSSARSCKLFSLSSSLLVLLDAATAAEVRMNCVFLFIAVNFMQAVCDGPFCGTAAYIYSVTAAASNYSNFRLKSFLFQAELFSFPSRPPHWTMSDCLGEYSNFEHDKRKTLIPLNIP